MITCYHENLGSDHPVHASHSRSASNDSRAGGTRPCCELLRYTMGWKCLGDGSKVIDCEIPWHGVPIFPHLIYRGWFELVIVPMWHLMVEHIFLCNEGEVLLAWIQTKKSIRLLSRSPYRCKQSWKALGSIKPTCSDPKFCIFQDGHGYRSYWMCIFFNHLESRHISTNTFPGLSIT